MLADAFRAENYRFWKNRLTVLWTIAFVPVVGVIFGAIGNLALRANTPRLMAEADLPPQVAGLLAGGPLDLGASMVGAAAGLAGPPLLLFALIGAATVYAGDYRWETWRLISARNSRRNLLLAKVGAVAVIALVALAAMVVAGVASDLIKASVFGRSLAFHMDGPDAGRWSLLALLSWWRVMQFTLLALLAATLSRSLLATLFVPIVVGVAGAAAPALLGAAGVEPDHWLSVLAHPGGAIEALQTAVHPRPGEVLPPGLAVKAWSSALLWTALPLAGSLLLFGRQDLSKE